MWIGRPKQDGGMNRGDEKTKAGQRRTGPNENREQLVPSGQVGQWVGPEELEPADEEKEGGSEGTRATTNKGVERSIQEVTENEGSPTVKSKRGIPNDVCGRAGQAGQEGVPWDETTTSEVVEDIEAKSTDTNVGEETYLVEGVRGAERSARHEM